MIRLTSGHSSPDPLPAPQGSRTPSDPQAPRRRRQARSDRHRARPFDPRTLPEIGKVPRTGSGQSVVDRRGFRRRPPPGQTGPTRADRDRVAHPPRRRPVGANRWGAHFRINLEWSRLDAIRPVPSTTATDSGLPGEAFRGSGSELAPPPAPSLPELAPPESDKEPLDGNDKTRNPPPADRLGFRSLTTRKTRLHPAPRLLPSANLPPLP